LRSPREPLNSEPTEALRFPVEDRQEAAAPPQQQPQPQQPAPAPREQVAKADPTSGIMVIDGDHIDYVPIPKGRP
jgi:hypothetical protein